MLQEINERLASLKSRLRQKKNWELRTESLANELKTARQEQDEWAARLKKEQRDVDRLTGMTLGALFYTLIGKRDEKLTKEEAEVLQVKLKYEEAADTVAELESELTELKRQLAEVQHIEAEIAAAMEEKLQLIQVLKPAIAEEFQMITEQEEEAQVNVKELQEAIAAGQAVIRSLRRAEDQLVSAKNWGTYDMLGGGVVATAIKHNRIDEARSAIHTAQKDLRRFQRELEDVERDIQIKIEIGGMLTFADYFFDGLIMDWIVQGRIQNTLDQISKKRSQINRLISVLETELRKEESEVKALQRRRTSLIESA